LTFTSAWALTNLEIDVGLRYRPDRKQRIGGAGPVPKHRSHEPIVKGEPRMAIDTFFAYSGVYDDVQGALDDYEAIKALHTDAGLIDAYDAAVIERKQSGKVKIVKKHETPTRVGGVLGGGAGLATGLVIALFPAAAIGGGLLLGTTAGGAILGAVAGHASAGMSRGDLKELGETMDAGQAGLVVVAVADMQSKVKAAMKRAKKIEAKELKADQEALESEAKEAQEAS
jgi:uncharacterized membrane protein